MKLPSSSATIRRFRLGRLVTSAGLMILAGLLLVFVSFAAPAGGWIAKVLVLISALLVLGGCAAYLFGWVMRIARGVRRARAGEAPPALPVGTPAARYSRLRKLVLWSLGLLMALFPLSLFIMGAASRRVGNVRTQVRPGMTTQQALESLTGWMMINAESLDPNRPEEGFTITGFHEGRYHLPGLNGSGPDLTEAELLQKIQQMAGGGEWELVCTYRTLTPARFTFVVTFAADGKVKAVSPVGSRD